MAELERLGFTIEGRGVTLSISGRPELFEKHCGTKVWLEEIEYQQPGQVQPETIITYRSAESEMHIKGLEQIIEGIVLTAPGVPFR